MKYVGVKVLNEMRDELFRRNGGGFGFVRRGTNEKKHRDETEKH